LQEAGLVHNLILSLATGALALELALATPPKVASIELAALAGKSTFQLALRDVVVCDPAQDAVANPIARTNLWRTQRERMIGLIHPANIYDPAECARTRLESA
jgi:hypothetical protein